MTVDVKGGRLFVSALGEAHTNFHQIHERSGALAEIDEEGNKAGVAKAVGIIAVIEGFENSYLTGLRQIYVNPRTVFLKLK
jgi:hypothetical protein